MVKKNGAKARKGEVEIWSIYLFHKVDAQVCHINNKSKCV